MRKETIGIVYHPDYLIHTNQGHPERKERLEATWEVLQVSKYEEIICLLEPDYADPTEIALIHSQDHVDTVKNACKNNLGFLDLDTYIVPESYNVALLSAGAALTGLKEIMDEGGLNKVFCLNRPPGHHAERNKAMGFCLFNNIAVAAKKAQHEYDLQRIAIIDWDVHHGNGTQNAFYEEDGVLFISIHQSPAYPGSGYIEEKGKGAGEGYTVNIPLPGGSGDQEYLKAFKEIIIPVINEYKPQLIMVSAGQDAHENDPLAGMSLTEEGFYYMAVAIKELSEEHSGGKVLLCLEGGYHLQAQANSVGKIIEGLSQNEVSIDSFNYDFNPENATVKRIEQVKEKMKNYWNSLG